MLLNPIGCHFECGSMMKGRDGPPTYNNREDYAFTIDTSFIEGNNALWHAAIRLGNYEKGYTYGMIFYKICAPKTIQIQIQITLVSECVTKFRFIS